MLVMGFDDERVRDAWMEELRREGAVVVVWAAEPVEGTLAAAMEEAREVMRALVEAVVEAFRPLVEVCQAIGEAVLGEIERVWALIEGAWEEPAGRYQGPRHYNCRCLPVERVDPVRAGRTRWWTRK
jgi:hypothetical protein